MPRVIPLSNMQQFAAINLLSEPGALPGPKLVPSCAQISIIWTLASGKQAHNVLYGRYTGGFAGTVAQANAIHTALTTGGPWTANLAVDLASTAALSKVTIRNVNVADQPIIESTNTPVAGTAVGTELPDETAIAVTLRTAKTGPQNRGRFYVPGFTSAAVGAGNTINATVTNHVQTWAGNIFNALNAQGYQMVLGQPHRQAYTSPLTGRQFPERVATSEPITGIIVRDNHWDSQRRRGLR